MFKKNHSVHCYSQIGITMDSTVSNQCTLNGLRCLFPFRKRSLPFLTVDAIIGNQAFSHGRCNFYHISSVSRSLIGREPWEMRVHTTAGVMNTCQSMWSIYCRLAPRKKTFFCGKIVNFNKTSTTVIIIKFKKRKKRRKEITGEQERSHDWTKKAPKPCEVLQRLFPKLGKSMKLLRSERRENELGCECLSF